jgi:hypothetical protein
MADIATPAQEIAFHYKVLYIAPARLPHLVDSKPVLQAAL